MIAGPNAGRGRRVVAPEPLGALMRRAANYLEGIYPYGDVWEDCEEADRTRTIYATLDELPDADMVPVASVRGGTWSIDNAAWIVALGPQVSAPLVAWLRSAADDAEAVGPNFWAVNTARAILGDPLAEVAE